MSQKCQHQITRGKNEGKHCTTKPKDGNEYCNKHMKSHAKAAETEKLASEGLANDPIFAEKAVETTKPTVKSSIWNLTINSNQVFKNMDDTKKQTFKKLIEFVHDPKNLFQHFISDRNSPDNPRANIKDVKTDYAFEVGGQHGLLHAHSYIRILHTGYLQMKLNDMRELFRRKMGKSVNIQAPVSSDSQASWEAYMHKKSLSEQIKL